jgi:hypothetical protein
MRGLAMMQWVAVAAGIAILELAAAYPGNVDSHTICATKEAISTGRL